MVTDPEKWVVPLKNAGGDQFLFHQEANIKNVEDLIKRIRDNGMKAGIVLKPNTPLDSKTMNLFERNLLDMLLIMTVEPGFGGQAFIGKIVLFNFQSTQWRK
jgi:ribulose-phosphate 3-epimerase